MGKNEYQITLTIEYSTIKPKRIRYYRRASNHKEAWDIARELCSDYNKSHKAHNAIITGVGKN
jgi:hypothetical protein